MLNVCDEIFRSIQGEGLAIGIPSIFVRLSGCNLKCRNCDTKYSWEEGKDFSVSEVIEKILEISNGIKHVTITGGEPLLQLEDVSDLVVNLHKMNFEILIETNGTIEPGFKLLWAKLSVSPKLSNFCKDYKEKYGDKLPYALYYKFVITNNVEKDVREVQEFLRICFSDLKLERLFNEGRIILQPNGLVKRPTVLLKKIADYVKDNNLQFRVLPQLHRMVWGMKRGV